MNSTANQVQVPIGYNVILEGNLHSRECAGSGVVRAWQREQPVQPAQPVRRWSLATGRFRYALNRFTDAARRGGGYAHSPPALRYPLAEQARSGRNELADHEREYGQP